VPTGWRALGAVAALGATLALGACGPGGAAQAADPGRVAVSHATALPSAPTKMICAAEARNDLRATLGVDVTEPVVARWRSSRYSCRYVYSDGAFTLAVQQLADAASATQYFDALASKLGRRTALQGLGQAATTTASGVVIVRKDDDVLTVDPHDLAARFGRPPDTRANVALSVAATIMGCWIES
jgi:hypothetical protein